MGRVVQLDIPAGEDHLGSVGQSVDVYDVTLVADTSIYADNDVLSATAELPNFFRKEGGRCEVVSVTLFDGDDQGTEVSLFFTTNSGSVGAANAALSPTDAIADDIQGWVQITAFEDMINSMVASVKNVGLFLEAAAGSRSIYIFTVVRSGTPTYTASGLKLKIGVRHF